MSLDMTRREEMAERMPSREFLGHIFCEVGGWEGGRERAEEEREREEGGSVRLRISGGKHTVITHTHTYTHAPKTRARGKPHLSNGGGRGRDNVPGANPHVPGRAAPDDAADDDPPRRQRQQARGRRVGGDLGQELDGSPRPLPTAPQPLDGAYLLLRGEGLAQGELIVAEG